MASKVAGVMRLSPAMRRDGLAEARAATGLERTAARPAGWSGWQWLSGRSLRGVEPGCRALMGPNPRHGPQAPRTPWELPWGCGYLIAPLSRALCAGLWEVGTAVAVGVRHPGARPAPSTSLGAWLCPHRTQPAATVRRISVHRWGRRGWGLGDLSEVMWLPRAGAPRR